MTESAVDQPDPALAAPQPPLSELTTEQISTEPAEDEPFSWGQPKSKAASRKGSKAGSKAGSKPTSKVASKAASPKGMQTPKQAESTSEEAGAGTSAGSPTAERPKPSSGAHSPLTTVPEDNPTEPVEAPPGNFYIANPDETETPDPPAQPESTSFPSFGGSLSGSLSGSVGQGLFGAASSALGGWGFGKKEDKSKPTTPKASTPTWGGYGSAPSVTESTGGRGGWGATTGNAPSVTESTGGSGGWGAATGNNGGSSLWTGLGEGTATGSTADLLATGSTADILDNTRTTDPLGQDPAENAFSYNPSETYATEEQGGEMPQGDLDSREPLTVQTDVTAEAGADTAEPTTAADESPEVEREGDGGQGEEEIGWGFATKTKKKKEKGGNTANTQAAQGGGNSGAGDKAAGEDVWGTTTKKKKGRKGK